MDVVVIDDDVANVDADTKGDPIRFGQVGIAPAHRVLDRQAIADCVHRAGEFDQHAVAHDLDDPAAVAGDHRLEQLGPNGLHARDRAGFIGLDHAAVADHVGGQNGRQPALDPFLGHLIICLHSPDTRSLSPARWAV